jgi:glycolate oxidase iron-sulfur subunit
LKTSIHPSLAGVPAAETAAELASRCVHCGFCLATCPTYLDNRSELDSPRGRIYLVTNLLERGHATAVTRDHLDACLTCRACETACPSGVEYAGILEAGRVLSAASVPHDRLQRTLRWLLRQVFRRPRVLAPALWFAQLVSPVLPASLRARVPRREAAGPAPDAVPGRRRMLLLEGCVQRAATPATNGAARRVAAALGIDLISVAGAGCCGALDHHLSATDAAREAMRRNIDAWLPLLDAGAEAIVTTASGCGAQISEYGALLADDPAYADSASRISAAARDIVEVLEAEPLEALSVHPTVGPVAVHTPCTQAHALGLAGRVGALLARLGLELAPVREESLCCGSAGSYSVLHPGMAGRLRSRKLAALTAGTPSVIVTANVGCQLHLDAAAEVPVMHWLSLVDAACSAGQSAPASTPP